MEPEILLYCSQKLGNQLSMIRSNIVIPMPPNILNVFSSVAIRRKSKGKVKLSPCLTN
jgi:hypothetical protein